MHVGTPALIVILTLQSATVTLSKSSTKASIMIPSTTVTLGTSATAASQAIPCTAFVEVGVAGVAVMFGVVSIIVVLLKQ